MIELNQHCGGDISQVQSVTLECIPEMVQMLNNPNPVTPLDAQLSLPYCAAVALVRGAVGLQDFSDGAIRNPEIAATIPMIHIVESTSLPDDAEPVVHVRFANGESEVFTVPFAKGAPQNPLSLLEVKAKFDMLTARTLAPSGQARLFEIISHLESLDNVATLEDHLRVDATG